MSIDSRRLAVLEGGIVVHILDPDEDYRGDKVVKLETMNGKPLWARVFQVTPFDLCRLPVHRLVFTD